MQTKEMVCEGKEYYVCPLRDEQNNILAMFVYQKWW